MKEDYGDMILSMELSLYPLGTGELSVAISQFVEIMEAYGLSIVTSSMSSVVSGKANVLFPALQKAVTIVAQKNLMVLVAKISNACPI